MVFGAFAVMLKMLRGNCRPSAKAQSHGNRRSPSRC